MRRGMTTYTTAKAAAIACGLCLALLALACLLTDTPALMIALAVLTAGPAALMVTGLMAGLLPAAFCLAAILAALGIFGGGLTLACGALFLVPGLGVFAYCLYRRLPFWRACGLIAGTLALSVTAIFLLLQGLTGGTLYQTAGEAAAAALARMPLRDPMLSSLVSMGLLAVPSSLRDTAVVSVPGGYALSSEVVNELLLQVRSYVSQLTQALIPSLLISGSGLNALAGLSLSLRWGKQAARKRAFLRDEPEQEIPDLNMPPLRLWHLPRPWGLRIGVLGLGYFLARFSKSDALFMLGTLMFQVFSLCFGVQGLAAINFAQHKRGTGRGWRTAVVVAGLLLRFMQTALIVVGVVDQFSNARGLRPPMRPRNEEDDI